MKNQEPHMTVAMIATVVSMMTVLTMMLLRFLG